MKNIIKIESVNLQLYTDWKTYKEKAEYTEKKLRDRIGYIIEKTFELFDAILDVWWIDGGNESEDGPLENVFVLKCSTCEPYVKFDSNQKGKYKKMSAVLNDGQTWELDEAFPFRWLFEDFEQEIIKGISLKEINFEKINVEVKKLVGNFSADELKKIKEML